MNNLDIQFSVTGITETWLRDSAHLVDISGFNFLHKHRLNRSGGVGLYLSNNFEFKTRDDICFDDEKIAESIFIEICKYSEKNIIVRVIYRPPGQNVSFF